MMFKLKLVVSTINMTIRLQEKMEQNRIQNQHHLMVKQVRRVILMMWELLMLVEVPITREIPKEETLPVHM